MTLTISILLVAVLIAVMFAVIACDEVRRLGRQVADLADELAEERELRALLDRRVDNVHRAGASDRRANAAHRAAHAFGFVEGGDGR